MLKVKTYLDKSTIPDAGIGCFAAEDIKKGDLIWELNPLIDRIYTDKNLESMSPMEIQFIKTYAYCHHDLYFLCVDNGRFFNHSDTPNTLDPSDVYCTYAKRDIKAGEEILSDYKTFGITDSDKSFNSIL